MSRFIFHVISAASTIVKQSAPGATKRLDEKGVGVLDAEEVIVGYASYMLAPGKQTGRPELGIIVEDAQQHRGIRTDAAPIPLSVAFKLQPPPEYSKANRDHKRNPRTRRKKAK